MIKVTFKDKTVREYKRDTEGKWLVRKHGFDWIHSQYEPHKTMSFIVRLYHGKNIESVRIVL